MFPPLIVFRLKSWNALKGALVLGTVFQEERGLEELEAVVLGAHVKIPVKQVTTWTARPGRSLQHGTVQ
jgi:hypothetical protein